MSDVSDALVLRLEATLAKFEKQMAKARQVGTRTATDLQNRFKESNEMMAGSAERSASAIAAEMDRLRSKYDPLFAASKRYEASLDELNRAHKIGVFTTRAYDQALERLNAEYALQTGAASRAATAVGRFTSITRGGAGGIQNVAYQVGDFAVQVGAGTSASIALGQQLPQLLGGFGAMGAVMGAVVAVGIPLVRTLISTGNASSHLDDILEDLEEKVSAYTRAVEVAIIPTDDLREKYGSATDAARRFISALAEINEVGTKKDLSKTLSEIALQFGGLGDELFSRGGVQSLKEIEITAENIADQFGVTTDQAMRFAEGLKVLSEAEGVDAQVAATEALLRLLVSVLGPIKDMDEGARAFAIALSEAGKLGAEVKGNIERTNVSIKDMVSGLATASSNMATLIGQAGSLGDNMYRAASAAWEYLRAEGARARSVGRGRGRSDPRDFGGSADDIQKNDIRAQLAYSEMRAAEKRRREAERSSRRGRRGRGGGRKREQPDLFEIGAEELQSLERQIELLGKSKSEVAALTLKHKLLDEAKKRGIAITDELVAKIDAEAANVGRLAEQYDQARNKVAAMESIQAQFKDSVIDAAMGGKDAMEQFTRSIKKAALEFLLFGEIGGKKVGGFGGIFGNIFAGFFDKGGTIPSGKFGVAGEFGPEFVKGPAKVISRRDTAAMTSGPSRLAVTITMDRSTGSFGAFVTDQAGRVVAKAAPTIIKQSVGAVQRGMRDSKSFGNR